MPSVSARAATKHGLTTFTRMIVTKVPSAATVVITCSGASCPFKSHTGQVNSATKKGRKVKPKKGTFDLTSLLRSHRLRAGTTINVVIRQKDTIGEDTRLVTGRGSKRPVRTNGCLEPGSTRFRVSC
jgi:hypothetical protein